MFTKGEYAVMMLLLLGMLSSVSESPTIILAFMVCFLIYKRMMTDEDDL